ncbi:MAG: bifunctional hydroxymethylpyrimidine kinase/phosphomethylpyrimidine kinase [Pyrinomonadaceae bacterium]
MKKICLTIAGLDPSGGAGIIADVKTFSAFGCFAAAAVSSVTFQSTTGVFGAVHQSAESVRRQIEPVLDDYDVAAVKTGMLPTREIIEEVAKIIKERGLKNVIVDPVVRSTSGFDLVDEKALEAIIEKLFPLADLITPNLPEAERITQIKIDSTEAIEKAAGIMRVLGAYYVLIKGGHPLSAEAKARSATDYLFVGETMHVFEGEFIEDAPTHGTGCRLSSAIAANLALGNDLPDSVKIAKDFVTEAIISDIRNS